MKKYKSPKPQNPELYARVKAEADAKFLAPTSIYKSAWIVREYKRRGGTYETEESAKKVAKKHQGGLKRWFREQWVDLNRPNGNKDGTYEPCGRTSSQSSSKTSKYPLCRPSKRITQDTPRTVAELTPAQVARAKKRKQRVQEKGRVDFK